MVKVPPPVWLAIYLIIAAAASALYPWKKIFDATWISFGVQLIVTGIAIAIWASSLFRRLGTEVKPTSETNKLLVTTGPYSITRNPMYVGLTLLGLGIALCDGALPMFVVPIAIFATTNWVHIPYEEAKMRRQFGEAYEEYTRKVRRWA